MKTKNVNIAQRTEKKMATDNEKCKIEPLPQDKNTCT